MSESTPATAFYDGDCPVCRIEVRHYQRIGGSAVEWVNVCERTDPELAAMTDGLSRETLLGAMHVREGENWAIGVDAFPALWARMPGWRRFTWLFKVPGVTALANLSYRGFLRWQRWHRGRRSLNRD
jgi:predicted DCC family thiol-disulfide oxidoreductase YuxK